MKIFTTKEIKAIDARTVELEKISQIDLMERAATSVAYEIMSRWRPDRRFVVFAGPGNNGGDALAVARLLWAEGYTRSTWASVTYKNFIRNRKIQRRLQR